MFAHDRDEKGVAGALGFSVFIHVLVLFLFFSYARQKELSSENYKLTEINFLEEIPDAVKPMQIEKPKNIFDVFKQVIPVKSMSGPALANAPLINTAKTQPLAIKPPALNMDKTAGKFTSNIKTIDLNNEIGRTRLSPGLVQKTIEQANDNRQLQAGTKAIDLNSGKRTFLPSSSSGMQLALTGKQNSIKTLNRAEIIKQTPQTVKKEPSNTEVNMPQKQALLIQGDVAGRKVLASVIPSYPRWAEEKGIECAVTLFFTVTPGGTVKNNIMVSRTSGYPELDSLASESLLQFKFDTLQPGADQSGYATFSFRLEK